MEELDLIQIEEALEPSFSGMQDMLNEVYISDAIPLLIAEVKRLRQDRAEVRRDALREAANLACLYCKNNIPLRRVEDNRICLTGYVHIVRQSYQPECYAGLIHQAITAANQGQGKE